MGKTSELQEKLDRIFSEFIRLRDSDEKGFCGCISCTSVIFWRNVDCGHFKKRGNLSTRYDPKNCNAQCKTCNIERDGNEEGYKRGLIRKYGVKVISDLETKMRSFSFLKSSDYKEMIDYYRREVKRLKKEKGL